MLSTYKIETFEDLIKALRERPEWLEELRRLILTEELLALPQKFQNFVEQEFKPLKQKVDRIEEDVEILKQDVAVLKQDVAVLKQDVAVLKQDVAILKQDVAILKQEVKVLKDDVADLKGDNFERKVREKAPAYFGRLIRKCKTMSFEDLADYLEEAAEKRIITEEEKDSALNIDVVVTGFLKTDKEKKVVLAGEVSIKADKVDVERAYERANVIGKALGLSAIAVVIGKETTEGAIKRADELGVVLI